MESKWIEWAQQLAAIAQNGLHYSTDPYDRERFEQVRHIAASMLAAQSASEPGRIFELLAGETGHATPKVDVRGAVFQGENILLVRERSDGLWTMPGGWVDVGESAAEAVVREVREESGYQTRVIKLAAVFDRNKHNHPPSMYHIYKLFFLCEATGGQPAVNLEIDAIDFFSIQALPKLSTGRLTVDQVHRLYAHYRQPDLPTEFD